jgi:hypothetical protein
MAAMIKQMMAEKPINFLLLSFFTKVSNDPAGTLM